MIQKKSCVFLGGKQIGVNCLRVLLQKKIIPELIVTNLEDDGEDTWHESLVKLAKVHNLNFISKTKFKDSLVISKIKETKPEIIFCIGSTQIIPDAIINAATTGCINIHPALLPKYRGRYSTSHVIFNGEKKSGATLHWITSGLDAGPIIFQKEFRVTSYDTAKTLYEKFTSTGTKLFKRFLQDWLDEKTFISYPQNENKASYFPKALPNAGEINWAWSGDKIFNFIRAMTFEPFPPATFKLGKKTMVIVDEKYVK